MSVKAEAAESMYERLLKMDMLNQSVAKGLRKSGLPFSLREDAQQEALLALWRKPSGGSARANGECVECAITISKRIGLDMRRRMSQVTLIPDDVFTQRAPEAMQTKADLEMPSVDLEILEHASNDDPDDDHSDIIAMVQEMYPEQSREEIDQRLASLSSAHYRLIKEILLGNSMAVAAERMGIREQSAQRYLARILHQLGRDDLIKK